MNYPSIKLNRKGFFSEAGTQGLTLGGGALEGEQTSKCRVQGTVGLGELLQAKALWGWGTTGHLGGQMSSSLSVCEQEK